MNDIMTSVREDDNKTMAASYRVSYAPVRSYQKTMALYVVAGDGRIVTVEDCPTGAFSTLVQVAAATIPGDPEAAAKLLIGLEYCHLADRWWALETLSEHGAKIPLFATERAAVEHSAVGKAFSK